jgi:hypothetical protein
MRLPHIDGISAQIIDDLKVILEHIRVLVIFGIDILAYRGCEGEVCRFTEG